jgi:hypothetical protein
MSGVSDALKQEALQREEAGFTTTRPHPLGLFLGETPWATANRSVVGSIASVGSYVVGYSRPALHRGTGEWDIDYSVYQPPVVRSDNFFVQMLHDASTMGGGAVLYVDFGDFHQRGVVALNLPRKKIHSVEITFSTAQLKRKTPRVILGGRDHGEENA